MHNNLNSSTTQFAVRFAAPLAARFAARYAARFAARLSQPLVNWLFDGWQHWVSTLGVHRYFKGFGKVSAMALFAAIDSDDSGHIDRDESALQCFANDFGIMQIDS